MESCCRLFEMISLALIKDWFPGNLDHYQEVVAPASRIFPHKMVDGFIRRVNILIHQWQKLGASSALVRLQSEQKMLTC
jgi:hypothetical protein